MNGCSVSYACGHLDAKTHREAPLQPWHSNPFLLGINMRYTFEDDFQTMRYMGVDSYRLSLSWNRLMVWDARKKNMVPNPAGLSVS